LIINLFPNLLIMYKKLLITLIAIVLIAPVALAYSISDDFSYGATEDGCYYYDTHQEYAYSRDGSTIGRAKNCVYISSSIGYVEKLHIKMSARYYDRIDYVRENPAY